MSPPSWWHSRTLEISRPACRHPRRRHISFTLVLGQAYVVDYWWLYLSLMRHTTDSLRALVLFYVEPKTANATRIVNFFYKSRFLVKTSADLMIRVVR
jgi:hypothetical protein